MTETGRRILLVDDDPSVLRAIGNYFEKLGWQVARAATGEEGLRTFERHEPHVTVVDYAMPGLSGLDVLERLRRRHAIVIMLTGHGEVDTAVEAMRLGAENFLQKPIDMPHLQQAVEKAAEKATLRREVVILRRRVPDLRKRLIQGLIVAALLVGAVLLGLMIGRGEERRELPIPIPIDGN
jgi:DNA-binding NtrC family response regulator